MMDSQDLQILFFGGFSLRSPFYELTPASNASSQMTLLIACLVSNAGAEISKDRLIDLLWSSDADTDMTGALRTLIYRTRKELQKFFPDESREYIKFSRNAYYWDTSLPYYTDIQEFETINAQFRTESDAHNKYELSKQLFRLYVGEFLPNYTYIEFVLYRNIYFRNQYVSAALYLCDYLYATEKYEAVITCCDQALLLYQEDERLYEVKIRAYLALGQADQALDYYHTVTTTLVNKFGIEISDSFSELYQQILEHLPLKKLDIDNLENTLSEPEPQRKTYYCDFYMFKNFYQLSKRSVRRSFSKRYLSLFTISDPQNPDVATEGVKKAMSLLFQIISTNLRQNDIFTRTSDWQYSVILTVPNENGANIAISRLQKQFAKENTQKNIHLEIETKLIE